MKSVYKKSDFGFNITAQNKIICSDNLTYFKSKNYRKHYKVYSTFLIMLHNNIKLQKYGTGQFLHFSQKLKKI